MCAVAAGVQDRRLLRRRAPASVEFVKLEAAERQEAHHIPPPGGEARKGRGNGGRVLRQVIVRVAGIARVQSKHAFRMGLRKRERVGDSKQGDVEGDKMRGRGQICGEGRPHARVRKKVRGQRCRREIAGGRPWCGVRIDAADPPAALFQQRPDTFVEAVHIDGSSNERIVSGKVKGSGGMHGEPPDSGERGVSGKRAQARPCGVGISIPVRWTRGCL